MNGGNRIQFELVTKEGETLKFTNSTKLSKMWNAINRRRARQKRKRSG